MGTVDPENAREAMPDSIRALYGKSIVDNAVHGSSSFHHAKKEIESFFCEELKNMATTEQEGGGGEGGEGGGGGGGEGEGGGGEDPNPSSSPPSGGEGVKGENEGGGESGDTAVEPSE